MPERKKLLRFPQRRAPKSQADKDRARFIDQSGIGVTFGPCTMPPWAGTSGFSDEEIAELDALFEDEPKESEEE